MNMFKATDAKTPDEYIAKIQKPRQSEIKKLHHLICSWVPKLEPFMVSGMIGYGKYHYKYKSGRDNCRNAQVSGDGKIIGSGLAQQHVFKY
jgi:hypothetical protein